MAKKSFKANNPNENLVARVLPSGSQENKIQSEKIVAAVEKEPEPVQKEKEKKKLKYLRLDITDYQDYISLMAEHATNSSGKHVSMTQYIQRLIEADKQKNIELFNKLEEIERMKQNVI